MDATAARREPAPADLTLLGRLAAEAQTIGHAFESAFSGLSPTQLDWKPAPERWSVGQCIEHLLIADGAFFPLFAAIEAGVCRRGWLERLPLLPRWWGRFFRHMLADGSTSRVTAPRAIRPSASAVASDIVRRFLDHQQVLIRYFAVLKSCDLAQIVTSPFAGFITYPLADACEIIVLHQRRHLAQAEGVLKTPGFPAN